MSVVWLTLLSNMVYLLIKTVCSLPIPVETRLYWFLPFLDSDCMPSLHGRGARVTQMACVCTWEAFPFCFQSELWHRPPHSLCWSGLHPPLPLLTVPVLLQNPHPPIPNITYYQSWSVTILCSSLLCPDEEIKPREAQWFAQDHTVSCGPAWGWSLDLTDLVNAVSSCSSILFRIHWVHLSQKNGWIWLNI